MPIRERAIDQSKLGKLCAALREIDYPVSKILYLREHGGPIVEDIEGKPESKRVTFLYYDEGKKYEEVGMYSQIGFARIFETGKVDVPGKSKSPTGGGLPKFVMEKIETAEGNIWTATVDLPVDSCFSYRFSVQPGVYIADPLNPQVSYSPPSTDRRAVFDLTPSGIKPQEVTDKIEKEGRLKTYFIGDDGILTEKSDAHPQPLEDERKLTVHLPQGYNDPANKDEKYSMRLFLDGRWYLDAAEVPAILDDDKIINIMLEPKAAPDRTGSLEERENRNRNLEYLPHRCDLLVLPNIAALANPPITSNVAYVKVGEQLFYVNKCGRYQSTKLELSSEAVAQFDKEIIRNLSLNEPRSLTDEELVRIAKITGHTNPYVGNVEAFAKFLSREFMDGVREKFRVSDRPSDITVCGSSLGGFAATYIGLHYPQVFGNVLTQSAALWVGGDLLPQLKAGKFDTAQLQKSCFYFEASKSDAPGISRTNPEFKDALRAQGIPSCFVERNGEHSMVTWAKTLPEAVDAIQRHYEMLPGGCDISRQGETLNSKV